MTTTINSTVSIPTPRGPKLAGVLHYSAAPNGVAVVLAPGQGYHKELPLMKRSAEVLSAAGFTALRFDWAYFTAKGQPSADLSVEREDVDAAIAFLRARSASMDEHRDSAKKIVLAGKSLGSLASLMRAGTKSDDLAGLALLTLPVHQPDDTSNARVEAADLDKAKCPVLIINGDSDPMSDLATLYRLAASAKTAPRIVIVPGDHGFETKPGDHPSAKPSVELAAQALATWARRFAE